MCSGFHPWGKTHWVKSAWLFLGPGEGAFCAKKNHTKEVQQGSSNLVVSEVVCAGRDGMEQAGRAPLLEPGWRELQDSGEMPQAPKCVGPSLAGPSLPSPRDLDSQPVCSSKILLQRDHHVGVATLGNACLDTQSMCGPRWV